MRGSGALMSDCVLLFGDSWLLGVANIVQKVKSKVVKTCELAKTCLFLLRFQA